MYKFRYTIKTSLEQIELVQDFLRERDCNFTHKQYKEYCYNELIYTIDTDTFIHRCTRLDIHSFKRIGETIVETEYTLEEIPLHLFPGIEKYNLIRSVEMSSTKFENELVKLKSTVEDGDLNVPCYYNVIVESYYEVPEVLKSIRKLIF
jgi:hypothetical protein